MLIRHPGLALIAVVMILDDMDEAALEQEVDAQGNRPAISAYPEYQLSGKVDARFWRVSAGVLVAAVLLAGLLCKMERGGLYILFFWPVLFAFALLGMVDQAVYHGKCRRPRAAAVLGAITSLVFIGSYWEISYHSALYWEPQETVQGIGKSGLPGVAGYFAYRCEDNRSDRYIFPSKHGVRHQPIHGMPLVACFVVEWIGLLVAGTGYGLLFSPHRNVFSEAHSRWTRSFYVYLCSAEDMTEALAAIGREDWQALARIPLHTSSRALHRKRPLLRVEYIPGAIADGVYVTIEAAGTWGPGVWRRLLPSSSSVQMARALGPGGQMTRISSPSSASSTDCSDPRSAAIAASQRQIAHSKYLPRDSAIVLPADTQALAQVRRHNPKLPAIVALSMAAVGPFFMLGAMSASLRDTRTGLFFMNGFAVMLVAALLTACVWPRVACWRRRRRLGERPGSFLPKVGSIRLDEWLVSLADQYRLGATGRDDLVLCAVDAQNQRLILEGIRYRYIIPVGSIYRLEAVDSETEPALRLEFASFGSEISFILSAGRMFWGSRKHNGVVKEAQRICARYRVQLGMPPIPTEGGLRGFEVLLPAKQRD